MYITEFENFSNTINRLPQGKIYFEKHGGNWDVTLRRCIIACKILKTFHHKYWVNKEEYNIKYKTTLLYKQSTVSFEYEPHTYTIIIKTGCTMSGGEFVIKNSPVDFSSLEVRLNSLINDMKNDIPSTHANKLLAELDTFALSKI